MNKGGVVIFKITKDEKVDSNLFGGLMNAMDLFAEKVANSKIDSIILRDVRYYFYKNKYVTFVASADKDEKMKKVESELNDVVNLFNKTFSNDQVDEWNGNSKAFEKFQKVLEDKFLKAYNTFKNEIWI